MSIADLRQEYALHALRETDLDPDPIRQFQAWFADAQRADIIEPNAMTLATASPDGAPSARIVLLKAVDDRGFVFYTNYQSDKGRELAANPRASLVFYWDKLERSVRVVGEVSRVSRDESLAYFRTRPWKSQIGACVSDQSRIVASRDVLEERFAQFAHEYQGRDVPMPGQWGGYVVTPLTIEFWQGRRSRLHDRLRYRANDAGDWIIERLAP